MKINNAVAEFVARTRHTFVKEYLLYSDASVNECYCFKKIFEKSKAQNKSYVENVDKLPLMTSVKVQGYKDGRLVAPAYIAQMCLDAVLEEGFTPDSLRSSVLVAGMLLTRKDVKDVGEITAYFPNHWSSASKRQLLALSSKLVGDINSEILDAISSEAGGAETSY